MNPATHGGVRTDQSAITVLARCNAAAVRNGRPAPMALEAGVGLLRDYYETHPEVSVAETAARCARLVGAYPHAPEAVDVDWRRGSGRICAILGLLMTNVLGSLVETDGARFDPHRATALYFRALAPRWPADQVRATANDSERLLREAGRGRWARWTVRLTRVCVLAIRLSEHTELDRDRFLELFFEIAPIEAISRLCRRAASSLRRVVAERQSK